MQPNGANLTGGGTGGDSADAAATTSASPYTPFNGSAAFPNVVISAIVVGAFGLLVGAMAVFS